MVLTKYVFDVNFYLCVILSVKGFTYSRANVLQAIWNVILDISF